jgi:hypothetical protein
MLEIGTYLEIDTGGLLSRFGLVMTTKRFVRHYRCTRKLSLLTILVMYCYQIVAIGSIAQLEELSGVKGINDLHRESVDHITIPSQTGRGTLHRVEEVFDCWFESGRCVLFSSVHAEGE